MPDTQPDREQGKLLEEIFLAAVVLEAAGSVLNSALSISLLPVLVNSQAGVPDYGPYQLTLSAFSIAYYYVLFFLVFYLMGRRYGLKSTRDYSYLLQNAFMGGLVGGFMGYLGAVWTDAIMHGLPIGLGSFGSGSAASLLTLGLQFVTSGIQVALIVLAGVVLRNAFRGPGVEPRVSMSTPPSG